MWAWKKIYSFPWNNFSKCSVKKKKTKVIGSFLITVYWVFDFCAHYALVALPGRCALVFLLVENCRICLLGMYWKSSTKPTKLKYILVLQLPHEEFSVLSYLKLVNLGLLIFHKSSIKRNLLHIPNTHCSNLATLRTSILVKQIESGRRKVTRWIGTCIWISKEKKIRQKSGQRISDPCFCFWSIKFL